MDRPAEDMAKGSGKPQACGKLQTSGTWRQIEREFLSTGDAGRVYSGLTAAIDEIALRAYRATIEPVVSQAVAMLAVGEYGRSAMFPYSGADIMILLDNEPLSPALKEGLTEFVRLLWDAGLRIAYSVRSIAECLEIREPSLEVSLSLLDRRFLAGKSEICARLESELPDFWARNNQKLIQHLCQLARVRHAKYRNTPNHLRPNVKECPGGLRDLRLISRLAAFGREPAHADTELRAAARVVSLLRCFLHYDAQGDCNDFDIEAQGRFAQQAFAKGNTPASVMREYFRNARFIFNEARRALDSAEVNNSSLLESFYDWRSRLSNSEFTVSRERVLLRNAAQLESDPGIVFRLLEFIGRHGIPVSVETERRLEAMGGTLTAYCAQKQPLWRAIKTILGLQFAGVALRTLQSTGLLTAIFPEWARVEHLPVTDSAQSYTVDEQTLIAIESVGELRIATEPSMKRFAELVSEIDNPALVSFALLFHKMGLGSANPLQDAVQLARTAMARIQMSAEEQSAVESLIAHQLDFSESATGRDLNDPATVRLIADRAGTIEQLKQLAAMTYADLAVVKPDAMTAWRLEQLWRAYSITRHELTRELETDRIQEVPEHLPGRAEFLKGFPVRYLRARSPAEIESHIRLYDLSRPTGVAVNLQRIEGAYQLTVVARDMPGLFASFAGAISGFGLDILKAEAFSNAAGIILDTFVFADAKRTLELNPPEVERLTDLIRRVALGKTDAQRLLRNRVPADPKKRAAPAQVQFDSEACETATLVEIITEDRPGLLYSLATVFSSMGSNIDIVLIDTKGHRAIDVFYVAHRGRKLTAEMQATLKERLLAAC